MELLTAGIIFGTVFFFIAALGGSERVNIRSRLEALRGAGSGTVETEAEIGPSAMQRLVQPALRMPVQQMKRMLPTTLLHGLEQRLILAGEPMTLNGFLIFQLMSVGAFLGMPALIVFAGGISITPLLLIVMLFIAGIGVMLPHFWLRQRVGARQNLIIKSLPDAFDLITTCVEAGLGLDAALTRVSEKIEGPFAIELRRALRDISLGKARREALRELGDRTGVPDLIMFVTAVVQAEQMGSSVGAVLRVQAEQLRVRRRQRAEEQAYKAPVKMIFPLVLCIFPTLFIVILGPAAITIIQDFPGG